MDNIAEQREEEREEASPTTVNRVSSVRRVRSGHVVIDTPAPTPTPQKVDIEGQTASGMTKDEDQKGKGSSRQLEEHVEKGRVQAADVEPGSSSASDAPGMTDENESWTPLQEEDVGIQKMGTLPTAPMPVVPEIRIQRPSNSPPSPSTEVTPLLSEFTPTPNTATPPIRPMLISPKWTAQVPQLATRIHAVPNVATPSTPRLLLRRTRNVVARKHVLALLLGRTVADVTKPALQSAAHPTTALNGRLGGL